MNQDKQAADQPTTEPYLEPVDPDDQPYGDHSGVLDGWDDFAEPPASAMYAMPAEPAEPVEEAEPHRLVRPYARTGGRTRPVHTLELETLLSYSGDWQTDLTALRADHQVICVACQTPQSTAELAVTLGLPLGAARVLIADVVELGLIQVHQLELVNNRPSMDLLERVHAGLLNL